MSEKKRYVFATANRHKLDEVREIFGESYEILGLADIGCHEDIPETGETLEENALLKARYVRQKYGLACFADDTGLEVDALHGAPGVYTARYAGDAHNDVLNRAKLLHELGETENRSAQFRTAIALIEDNGIEQLCEGIVRGRISHSERGTAGFGYDPVFVPEGYSQTFAELGQEVKNQISHRARAVEKLRSYILSQEEATN